MDANLIWEVSFTEFLFVTGVFAGASAWMTGRAVARAWESDLRLGLYMLLLAAATRFIHFALFGGALLSLPYYARDLAVLCLLALIGKRMTRSAQMAMQYGFERRRAADDTTPPA